MPVRWDLEMDVLSLSFEGEYSFEEIAQAAKQGLAAAGRPIRLLIDARGTSRLPDALGVRQRIALLQELEPRLQGPVALVAIRGAMYGVARQIAQQAESGGRLTIAVFDDPAKARAWIRNPGPLDD